MSRILRQRALVLAAFSFTPGSGVLNPEGRDTQELYAHPPEHLESYPRYSSERDAFHKYLIETNLKKATRSDQPTAVFVAGGSGVGKSSLLQAVMAKEAHRMVHIDPDMYKTKLPEFDDMSQKLPEQAAVYVHEESSYLAKRTLDIAMESQLDLIYDSTFSNVPFLTRKFNELKANGYFVIIYFADCPFDVAMERVQERFRQTGRSVPPEVVKQTHNKSVTGFNALKKLADKAIVFDTSGRVSPGVRQVLSYTNGNENLDDPNYRDVLVRHGHQLDAAQLKGAATESPAKAEPALVKRLTELMLSSQYDPSHDQYETFLDK